MNETTDLCARLRGPISTFEMRELCNGAADEIERLRAKIVVATAALEAVSDNDWHYLGTVKRALESLTAPQTQTPAQVSPDER